ncbi:hypothetical protein PS15p_206057 [Mucor circinelloides]
MEFKDKSLLKVLREQFPKGLGLKPRVIGKNQRKALEIGFSTEKACRDALLNEFKIGDQVIEVSKTLTRTANVINIGISEIPLMDEDELKDALVKTFERFGDILNIGISKSGDSDWFTGRGFATLNRDKLKESTYAAQITPQVELAGFPDSKLHLVWSQMKPICPDCHTDEHIKFDCPKGRRRLCHRCKSPNHLIAHCPTAPWYRNKPEVTNNESQSSNITPESGDTGFKLVRRRSGSGREVSLSDLLQQGQQQQARSNNQFDLLASDSEMEEDQQQEASEVNGVEGTSNVTDGVTMIRSISEPTHRQLEITPVKSTSTPRNLRSKQTKKVSELVTNANKITKINTKRNLEEAISPEAQQAATPINKKFNGNTEKTSLNESSTPADTEGGKAMDALD